MLVDENYLKAAYFGDQEHKRDLLLIFRFPSDTNFARLITATEQATYLRNKFKEFVPPNNPNGTAPSDHSVSTAFEYQYHTNPDFVFAYFTYIRRRY
jgi:hypothetical protein